MTEQAIVLCVIMLFLMTSAIVGAVVIGRLNVNKEENIRRWINDPKVKETLQKFIEVSRQERAKLQQKREDEKTQQSDLVKE